MSDLLSEEFLTALLSGGLVAAMPLLFASLGELVSEQAGVLNVGLEGYMLFGAFLAFVVAYNTGSEWLGLLAGIVGGAVGSLLMVVFSVRMRLDQIVIGIAIILLAEGATSLIFDASYAESRPRLGPPSELAIPVLKEIPILGDERLQPARDRLPRDRAGLRRRLGRCGGPRPGSASGPPASAPRRSTRPASASPRPAPGRPCARAGSPGSAAAIWRSSAPAASPPSSPRARASSRS